MARKIVLEHVPLSEVPAAVIARFSGPCRPVVLVVDDERVIADTLSAILEINGYTAMAAYDAASALEIAQVIPPDLLITDVVMPGMSGVELAMTLREKIADCKVLLFSGQAATVDLLAIARSAGHDFTALTKPVPPTAMLAHVSALVPQYVTQYVA